MSVKIFHNPRCSKSRQTLELLENKGVKAEVVRYLETPPSKAELKDLLQKLELSAKELIRFKETVAKELGIKRSDDRSEQEWIDLMVSNPVLMERPIVVSGKKAALGRPPENVLSVI